MWYIFKREFNSFLNSLIAYIVISIFLTGMGLLMWVFPETNVLDYGYAEMGVLFSLGPYVLMFLIPAITMKMFAEEHKSGTFEFLATQPVSDWSILMGKYSAALLLVVFAIIPTTLYYFSIYTLGNPIGNIDTPGVIGSYAGFIFNHNNNKHNNHSNNKRPQQRQQQQQKHQHHKYQGDEIYQVSGID